MSLLPKKSLDPSRYDKGDFKHEFNYFQMSAFNIYYSVLSERYITSMYDPQIITEYKSNQLPVVLDALERMHAHLTAAVVSNDPLFLQASTNNSNCLVGR